MQTSLTIDNIAKIYLICIKFGINPNKGRKLMLDLFVDIINREVLQRRKYKGLKDKLGGYLKETQNNSYVPTTHLVQLVIGSGSDVNTNSVQFTQVADYITNDYPEEKNSQI